MLSSPAPPSPALYTIFSTPKDPPAHVAVVFLCGSEVDERSELSETPRRRGRQRHAGMRLRRKAHQYDGALMESVARVISWASLAGISELSIYDNHGVLDDCRDAIVSQYQRLPVSPPDSRSPSPRRSAKSTLAPQNGLGQTSYADVVKKDTVHEPFDPVTSFTVFAPNTKPLHVHLLTSDSREILAHIAREERAASPRETISQQSLDERVRETLQLSCDPELLLVHRIKRPSFLGSLLARAPPELGGFPCWPLRITEIYMHPTPLPIPSMLMDIFSPLLQRSRTSSLSLLRKTAKRFPRLASRESSESGVLHKSEWDGAMKAWQNVEQRLGK
ncbi:hypothetical protein BD324DRAFT_636548 [Kockovaella imperatae]|uniref:ditrans,polycis-polyprenyl diphosphate synthase [(2E,6E)-farnesyldiphosphate specific] n=1 Tax=Kockovaella imperatae TaxID=4999 RepID=A0A1Y1U9A7_9TREE|nr:hypothetical protein BD324DRAFT_636548 [Kockovaella imperatae]ORX34592.1 hypothetical protein BD324DRAFT_636548 [Kockovaella imperatae]